MRVDGKPMNEPINNLLPCTNMPYTTLTIALGRSGGCFSIISTNTGFDVIVPEGISMDECATSFIDAIRRHLKSMKP